MAISDTRTKNSNLTELVNNNIMKVTDKTKDSVPNTTKAFTPIAASSKVAAMVGKKNIFDTSKPMNPGNSLISVSAFPVDGNPSCVESNVGTKSQDDRLLSTPNIDHACGPNIDSGLVQKSVLDHVTAGLPESKIVAIETMLSSEITKHIKTTTHLGGINKPDSVLKGVSSVSKALSDIGSPLKEKVHLKSLLGCVHKSGLNGGESSLIQSIILAGLLTQALCISVPKFLDTISELSSVSGYNNGDIIRSVVTSFDGATNRSAADKVAILSAIPGSVGPRTGSDIAITSDATNQFITGLGSGNGDTTNSSVEFNNANVALSTIDPNWDKDSLGNSNLSKTKGSGYLTSLSRGMLSADSIDSNLIDNSVTPPSVNDPRRNSILILASNVTREVITDGAKLAISKYS